MVCFCSEHFEWIWIYLCVARKVNKYIMFLLKSKYYTLVDQLKQSWFNEVQSSPKVYTIDCSKIHYHLMIIYWTCQLTCARNIVNLELVTQHNQMRQVDDSTFQIVLCICKESDDITQIKCLIYMCFVCTYQMLFYWPLVLAKKLFSDERYTNISTSFTSTKVKKSHVLLGNTLI